MFYTSSHRAIWISRKLTVPRNMDKTWVSSSKCLRWCRRFPLCCYQSGHHQSPTFCCRYCQATLHNGHWLHWDDQCSLSHYNFKNQLWPIIYGFQVLIELKLPKTFLSSAGREAKHNPFFSCKYKRSTSTIVKFVW